METKTVNGRGYAVLRLLGRGKGGYSYLVRDGTGTEVVLKQIHHEPCDYYEFGNKMAAELRDYATLSALGIRMPRLLEADQDSERLIKEYISGPTVAQLVERGPLPPGCLRQVLAMCALLYSAGLNIDYFPTNFIWHDGLLYYVDYECNPYAPEWDFENWGAKYWNVSPA